MENITAQCFSQTYISRIKENYAVLYIISNIFHMRQAELLLAYPFINSVTVLNEMRLLAEVGNFANSHRVYIRDGLGKVL
jgi:hypothetical protein